MLRFGVMWLLMFEGVYRTRRWLRKGTVPLYTLAAWAISPLLSAATLLTPVIGVEPQRRELFRAFYADPAHWLPNLTRFPHNVASITIAVAFVLISYFLIFRSLPWTAAKTQIGAVWSGCKGADMAPSKSQTTRLLCASAFLGGATFRDQVLTYLKSESHGASPELGVDIRLVAHVCQYAKRRAGRFDLYLFLALLAGLIAAAVNLGLGIAVIVLAAGMIFFMKTYGDQVSLVSVFHREEFSKVNPEKVFPAHLDESVLSALPRDNQNLIVYTGFTPFAGAGANLGGWSFVVDISKPDSNIDRPAATPELFKVQELYQAIDERTVRSQLEGLEIKDCFFVNGREIRADRDILPDIFARPVQSLNAQEAQKYFASSDGRIRHYKWIRVHDWGQELVTSYFLRCSLRGDNLFVEINRFLLTPLNEKYRTIDAMVPPKTIRLVGMLIGSLIAGPVYALVTPFLLLGRMNEAFTDLLGGKEKARRRLIEENLLFDYGAGQGLRQAFSSGQFAHYFQKADGDFYAKMLEGIIIDTIISFLDEHHIDTSGLRERRSMILNSGIIVQGGDVKAESLAVGIGAQATKTQAAPSPKAKGAAA
jgi:hypothetical protein